MIKIDKFLIDREQRVKYQESLIDKYDKTLVVLRINFMGAQKINSLTKDMLEIMKKEIEISFNKDILYSKKYSNLEGDMYFFIIDKKEIDVKKSCIAIEYGHILGRCVDIDVYDKISKRPISRKSLGYSARKCFLCDESAHQCSRNKTHEYEQLYKFFYEKYREYLSYTLSRYALKSAIYEISTYPSFGLVSPLTCGSHKDMNFFTFLESSFAIENYFYEISKIGYSDIELEKSFVLARELGKNTEEKMSQATHGVNTHKGLIFLFGIVILAVSRVKYLNLNFSDITNVIKEISKDILKDFDNLKDKKNLTHGEKIYLKYKIPGVRGEVKNGLSIIFDKILPFYSKKIKEFDKNIAMSMTLIFIMSILEDSTIIHRKGIEVLKLVQIRAKNLVDESNFEKLAEFEKECISENISPGGSADMLCIVMFIHEVINNLYLERKRA